MKRPRPRRLFPVLLVALLLTALLLRFGWWWLPRYVPASSTDFAAAFRTMAEHDEHMRGKDWPYVIEVKGERGALLYYGSRHTSDDSDPQIADMRARWQAFTPTVAATENRLGPFLGTTAMGISYFGEFAALAALGRADDLPVYSLEPSWAEEVAELKRAFPTEEITLFYTLRVFVSERGPADAAADVDDLAAHLLAKRGAREGLEGSLPDLAALDALWDERFAHLGPWRLLPHQALSPAAGGHRLQEIATLANEVRDRHAARVLLDLVGQGERVFAVAGGSHVVKQEPVLRAGIE